MSVLQFFYATFLRLSGLGLIAASVIALGLPSFAANQGLPLQRALPFEAAFVGLALGLFLLIPWWLPRGLRHPSKTAHMIWIGFLAGCSWFACQIWIDTLRTLEQGFGTGTPMGPEVVFAWGAGAMIAAAFIGVLVARRKGEPEPQAAEPEPHAAPDPSESFLALSIHNALLALGGVVMIVSGVGIFLTMRRDAVVAAFYAENNLTTYALISTGLCVLLGLSLLTKRTMPRFVCRPTRWFHFPGIGVYLVALSCLAVAPLYAFAIPALMDTVTTLPSGQFPDMDFVQAGPLATLISLVAFLGLIVTTIAVIRRPVIVEEGALRPYSAQRVSDVPEAGKKKDLSKAKLPEPKLPSIGAAMKLYVAADWLVMRLLGAGLLGTAYILYGLIEGGRDYQAIQLSYGQDPMHALYGYTAAGVLMTVPFLLPRFITSPRNVVGGLVKAVLLVAAALVLLPMVHVAIDMFTPDIYHATLHTTVPNLFKAIAAVAVTSALIISFFRQLGATPQVDYLGNQVLVLSEKDLRELRNARNEQNSI